MQVAGLVQNSIVDGPGIRFTVFVQGCPHHCAGCHNPETWNFAGGTAMTPEEIFRKIEKDPLVHGVTFSGGEPFAQAGPLAKLAALLRAKGYEVASYTGYTFEHLLEKGTPEQLALLQQLDTLIDGPFVEAQLSLELAFRGSENQRILHVPASLAAGKAVWRTEERWVRDEIH